MELSKNIFFKFTFCLFLLFIFNSLHAQIIETVTGHGIGDGAPATQAELNAPSGVAFNSLGNLYIADTNYNCIRLVAAVSGTVLGVSVTQGHIYTIAGNGTSGFSGDGGPATQAALNTPKGMTIDNLGNLYIADTSNNRIRLVAAVSGTVLGVSVTPGNIYTIVGNGTFDYRGDGIPATQAAIFLPFGITLDSSGNLYIADTGNNRIRLVAAVTGTFFN